MEIVLFWLLSSRLLLEISFRILLLIPIIGFSTPGTTQILAHMATLFMFNESIGNLYCAAPTHIAATSFADRLFSIALVAAKHLGPNHRQGYMPVILRGYRLEDEVRHFWEYAQWFWTENEDRLNQIPRQDLKVSGPWRFKFSSLKEARRTLGKAVKEVLGLVIMAANAVCTTPNVSGDEYHADYNRNGCQGYIVLDGAGAMLQADALLVWGYGFRPCLLAGDPNQVPSAIMTSGKTKNGRALNAFAQLGNISALKQIQRFSWPCFVLDC
ncbi:hypothetical protein B0T17DRAFT_601884 [Bombardia bombarda]|uniref:Uncharacterized protein n=1 Tax=Bombardia bombarda TaxID=252184 RepID=A0AA39WIG8_9PEZI|nr:hypothetical protein B0T17DRAFT_601884 [Bombardia bombarda]